MPPVSYHSRLALPRGFTLNSDALDVDHQALAAHLFEITVAPSSLVRGNVALTVSQSQRASELVELTRPRRSRLGLRRRRVTRTTSRAADLSETLHPDGSAPLHQCTLTIPLNGNGRLSIHAVHHDPAKAIKQVFARAQRELQRRKVGNGRPRILSVAELSDSL